MRIFRATNGTHAATITAKDRTAAVLDFMATYPSTDPNELRCREVTQYSKKLKNIFTNERKNKLERSRQTIRNYTR